MNEMDMFFSSMFGPRDPWESYNRPQMLSLRVRLNPDATLIVTGRWMDDGQFSYGYYDYLLRRAARKAKPSRRSRSARGAVRWRRCWPPSATDG